MKKNEPDLLDGLSAELLGRIRPVRRAWAAGTLVHEAGEPCETVDLICSGRLAARLPHADGANGAVFEFAEGFALGTCLLFQNAPYPFHVECETDCELLQLGREDVELLLRSDAAFMMRFLRTMSLTSIRMNQKLQMLTKKSLRRNLEDYLRALAQQQGTRTVVLPLSKKQLADHFGVQRPSLFRELKRMRDEGLIEIDNRAVTIKFSDVQEHGI